MQIEPNPTPEQIWRAFQLLGPIVLGHALTDKDVGTSETKIAHGLGRVPSGWLEYSPLEGSDPVTQSTAPDSTYLYLIAASAVTANIWVW